MLESELFGHEKGAFTGALSQRKGRFELADGGTIFLDEIGEISAGFQSKLLRVLQEGEFERVGGSETIKVDARVVAATNRDLEEDVRKGIFRSDLYFRLCVIPIQLPPLRERAQDIPLLANSFLRRYNENNGTQLVFDRDALEVIQGCAFPGNIRELQSCVSRTAAFCTGNSIQAKDFACSNGSCLSKLLCSPGSLRQEPVSVTSVPSTSSLTDLDSRSDSDSRHEEGSVFEVSSGVDASSSFPDEDSMPHGSSERMRLLEAMERSGWVQAKAARLLGLTARQVCYALRKHGIEVKKF
jgi:Nif-specific regulatory protein